ncbi:MAG: hypothetical protein QW334_01565 [Thermofilum sp.]
MRSRERLWEVCVEIYCEAFRRSKPRLDFMKVYGQVLKGRRMKQDWFLKFYLPEKEQEKIIEKICGKHRLDKYEKHLVSVNYHLGCSPTSSLERWLQEWGGEPPETFTNIEELFEK